MYQSQEDKFSYLVGKKRKEATQQEKRQFAKQFLEAKQAECKSWFDNDVFELVDMRKLKIRNYVAGRWVLTIKKDKDGNFLKCKARWVLKGFQDRQKDTQQTDSPAASRSGFAFWTWPELRGLEIEENMAMVTFDQGAMGHKKIKPTTLMTNLPHMKDLHNLLAKNLKHFRTPLRKALRSQSHALCGHQGYVQPSKRPSRSTWKTSWRGNPRWPR